VLNLPTISNGQNNPTSYTSRLSLEQQVCCFPFLSKPEKGNTSLSGIGKKKMEERYGKEGRSRLATKETNVHHGSHIKLPRFFYPMTIFVSPFEYEAKICPFMCQQHTKPPHQHDISVDQQHG
jgi:hypothetical protein